MARRNHTFEIGEYYHCYNRGVDKRKVFMDTQDYAYFLESLHAYNLSDALGSLRLYKDTKAQTEASQIVSIVSYCLLPNHFHLILRDELGGGISKYLQKVGIGYTMYFNQKHKRSGALFQGGFKSKHIARDQDLRQLIAYVYYNNKIHDLHDPALYRNALNTKLEIVRDLNSDLSLSQSAMIETIEAIKELRLSHD